MAATNRRSINAEIIAPIQSWIKAHKEQVFPSGNQILTKSEIEELEIAINILTKIKEGT